MAFAVLLLAIVVIPIFIFEQFVAGGIVATSLRTEGWAAAGVAQAIIVLPALTLMVQSLPVTPLTNFYFRRHAIELRGSAEFKASSIPTSPENVGLSPETTKLVRLPNSVAGNEQFVLFLAPVGGSIATRSAMLTLIPAEILVLLLGTAATATGLSPDRAVQCTSSFGIAIAGAVAVLIACVLVSFLQLRGVTTSPFSRAGVPEQRTR